MANETKFHTMAELGLFMVHAVGDPSLFLCYLDEAFVGHIVRIAFSRGGNSVASTTPTIVLRKYRADHA